MNSGLEQTPLHADKAVGWAESFRRHARDGAEVPIAGNAANRGLQLMREFTQEEQLDVMRFVEGDQRHDVRFAFIGFIAASTVDSFIVDLHGQSFRSGQIHGFR